MAERPKTANYIKAFDPESGDLMTVEDYLVDVEWGGITDDDGMGVPVRDGLEADVPVGANGRPSWLYPSDGIKTVPEDATHILWFNK